MDDDKAYMATKEALKQQYLVEGRLGKGAYGQVFKAVCRKEGKSYAIKTLDYIPDERREKYQTQELEALIRLSRLPESKQYFVKYFGSWFQWIGKEKKLCIKMELCSGDLETFVYKHKHFHPQTVQGPRFYQHVFREILNGLDVIHSIGWVHRDIHPGNILLVNSNPQRIDDIHIKIGDFGLAKHIGLKFTISPGLTVHHCPQESTAGKANIYVAPEFSEKPEQSPKEPEPPKRLYDEKVDLYSAGIVLYFLSRYPRNRDEWEKELEDISKGELNIHERYKDDEKLPGSLIKLLLEPNPDERPTACEAKAYMHGIQETIDGNKAPKTRFYVGKENDKKLRYCFLSTFTFRALKAAIENRIGVKSYDLEHVSTVEGEKKHIPIENDEEVEYIFTNAAQTQNDVVVIVLEKEEDNDTATKRSDSGDVIMISA